MTEREAALAVVLSRGVGPVEAGRLAREYGSFGAVVRAALGQTRCIDGTPEGTASAIRESVRRRDWAEELELAASMGARFGIRGDPDYPAALAEMASAPVGVFVAGDELSSLVPMVGVVGTRTPTPRGAAVATGLAADLARAGVTVVSGMARGIDSRAHRGAIEAGGRTVAVLGCGLARTYPPENAGLKRDITANGSVVSEFSMRAEPLRGRFPRRNRIIAGLSAGVVVVEAAARSGALITSARALEQGREVFAVPGPVDEPLSAGPNRLIKAGAKLVEDAGDVLDELERAWGPFPVPRPGWGGAGTGAGTGEDAEADPSNGARDREAPRIAVGALPRTLAGLLSLKPVSVDELVASTGAPVAEVLSALLRLELTGHAERSPGGRFIRGPRGGTGRRRGRASVGPNEEE